MTKCPECDAEIDLDEDEVEEGEILSCPECDVELEVTQTHPVHLIVISEDDEEDEEEEDEKPASRKTKRTARRTKKRPGSFHLSSHPRIFSACRVILLVVSRHAGPWAL